MILIRAAKLATPPSGVTTIIPAPNTSVADMVITWTPEYDGGSQIFAYKIEIL